jgi:hypothetical protein
VAGLPPCWPSFALGIPIPGGTGSNLYWGAVGEVGSWYGWRCPVDATTVRLVSKLVRKAYKGPSIMSLLDEALTHPRLLDALPVLWNKYDAPCDKVGVTPELLAACDADMLALSGAARTGLLPPVPPAPPVPAGAWVVAPYALSKTTPPTRPVFGFQRGRRVAQTYSTAEVGQPCNLSVATVVEGALTYAAFGPLFSPGEVAVCVRKP